MSSPSLIERNLRHVWHPCSQMKDYESFPPIEIVRAQGSYLYTRENKPIIDAISSWWCKSLGHAHADIKKAVAEQMEKFEHIIAANTISLPLVELSEKLSTYFSTLKRCFYADNGSTAIEVALKMALQYQHQIGRPARTKIMGFENGYHGETLFTLSVSDCDLYSSPYKNYLHDIEKIHHIPYVSGENDPYWVRLSDAQWQLILQQIEPHKKTLAAFVFEPILQGSGGMKVYSPDLLRRLRQWANENDVLLVADEIMTGFGRTGKMFACEHAQIEPDFICLSKGLTSGYAPMSVVVTSDCIYEAFYDDYQTYKAFMHSNTFCGYPLAAAAANACCKIYATQPELINKADDYLKLFENLQKETKAIKNIRHIGHHVAAELCDTTPRAGFELMKRAVKKGLLIRPLGNTLYLLPPLNTTMQTRQEISTILHDLLG